MENQEPVFEAAEGAAYIAAKFREQGDFLVLDGVDLDAMVACAQQANRRIWRLPVRWMAACTMTTRL